MKIRRLTWALGAFTCAAALAGAASACDGAGVITRIDGLAGDVVIDRDNATVSRPRVLEVICAGDQVSARGKTVVTLQIDGRGKVVVDAGSPYRVSGRSGAPSAVGNAYRTVSDQVMPDMKRMPWDVRLKGQAPLTFSLLSMGSGAEQLVAGRRDILVRLVGGEGPYSGVIANASGASVGTGTAKDGDLIISGVTLVAGQKYTLNITDASGEKLAAEFSAVSGPAPSFPEYAGLGDPEVQAAAAAVSLARSDPGKWGFEAVQVLNMAPKNGLDRDQVYARIETYD